MRPSRRRSSSPPPLLIAHFSDTHGLPGRPVPRSADIVVHTGDMLPNRTRGNREVEVPYQSQWLRDTMRDWAKWLGGRKMVRVPGNHDFYNVAPTMRAAGLDVHDVFTDGPVVINGFTFAGVPYIPPLSGEWNHETPEGVIADQFKRRVLAHKPDVIVNHCPLDGVLDRGDWHDPRGSSAMLNALMYGKHMPKLYLHGHAHGHGGSSMYLQNHEGSECLVVNAATTCRLVRLTRDGAVVVTPRNASNVAAVG